MIISSFLVYFHDLPCGRAADRKLPLTNLMCFFCSRSQISDASFLGPTPPPSFPLLISSSLYHSVNELKLSTSHKGSTIFLLSNVGSNVHCLPCKGTCPQWSWMLLCVRYVGVPHPLLVDKDPNLSPCVQLLTG